MGLPALVTDEDRRLISENAACRPYHWAEHCLRPSAIVRGSAKVASSVQKESFLTLGRPAKSWTLRSRVSGVSSLIHAS
jgi:hypothetical protein